MALPFNHQNSHANITVLVVDDDPNFLSVIPNMLKNPSYRDESFGEITVMTANDSSEAISTLRGQCNNIDAVITDYHMPGLNGVQLKKKIKEEFGNLPVIVISADMSDEIEQETLSSGATCFMRKPIKPNDLNVICEQALDYKMNGENTDNSKEIHINSTSNPDPDEGNSQPESTKKTKIKWTGSLENDFCKAIQHIGVHKATPKKILEFMNLDYLTRAHVASKLQKYRKFLKKIKNEGIEKSRRATTSSFRSSSCIQPEHSYNTSLSKINIFDSQPGYGFGQSSPMITNADFHGSVNYMNRGPNYNLSLSGSNMLPMRGSLGFSSGMFPSEEEWNGISGTSQESQPPRFGKYCTTNNVLGMNSILTTGTMGSNYAGITIDEIGVDGNGNESLGGIRVHGTGSLGGIRVHDTGNGSLGGIQVHGTNNDNGSLGENLGGMNSILTNGTTGSNYSGIRIDETGVNGNGTGGSLGGMRVHGTGSLGGIRVHDTGNGFLGGIQVHGTSNGNGSLGENLGGMNSILTTGTMGSNYSGIRIDERGLNGNGNGGSLGGMRVHGNGSLNGIRVHDTGNGSLGGIQVHGTSNGNGSLGQDFGGMNSIFTTGTTDSNYSGIRTDEIGVNGNGTGGSLGGMRFHGTGSLGGIRVHDTTNVSLGGIQVHGTSNGNGSLGENLGGMNSILTTGTMGSNYSGIRRDERGVNGNGNGGSLGGMRVYGNGSFDGIRVHDTGNGSLGGIQVHGTSNDNGSLGEDFGGMNSILTTGTNEMGVDGNGNGSLGGIKVHGTGSLGGIGVHGTSNGSVGGIQVHDISNGNGFLGENLGGMNWNFNNENMSNHGSSTSRFPSALSSFLDNKDQSQNYLNAQTDGVVPVQENSRTFNDHHGINEFFCDTINSQFDQNQHQGNVTGENHEVSTVYPLEDIGNWSLNNGDYNEETLNSLAANSEMYFPTDQDMNITNQEHGAADLTQAPLLFDQDFEDENFMKYLLDHDMN